jgi:hypothetical protein
MVIARRPMGCRFTLSGMRRSVSTPRLLAALLTAVRGLVLDADLCSTLFLPHIQTPAPRPRGGEIF